MLIRITVLTLLMLAITCPAVHAEDTYRWRTRGGLTMYGSKPPPDAVEVEKLGRGALSKYSSRKMIDSYSGYKKSAVEPKEVPPEVIETPLVKRPADLKQTSIDVERDRSGRITSCRAAITNSGDEPATGVSISFLFTDGTLIPAAGPAAVEPDSASSYELPQEQLPLKLARGANTDPQVLIDYEQKPLMDDSFSVPSTGKTPAH